MSLCCASCSATSSFNRGISALTSSIVNTLGFITFPRVHGETLHSSRDKDYEAAGARSRAAVGSRVASARRSEIAKWYARQIALRPPPSQRPSDFGSSFQRALEAVGRAVGAFASRREIRFP